MIYKKFYKKNKKKGLLDDCISTKEAKPIDFNLYNDL